MLQNGHSRMYIAHSYTAFFDVLPGGIVNILKVMTIEEAHKRYKRLQGGNLTGQGITISLMSSVGSGGH